MKGCILTIGTELLFGQIQNTNATYLSRQLNNLGIDILYHRTVGDNSQRLKNQILNIFTECNLIITSGGLGPTQDDLTKETISKVFNRNLVLNKEELKHLEHLFSKRGSKISKSNIKQVMMPERGIALHNNKGTAPGFVIEGKRRDLYTDEELEVLAQKGVDLDEICIIASLPGPPRELIPMFTDSLVPYLKRFSNESICYKFIKTIGIGESDLEELLLPLINDQSKVTIAPYASLGEVYLRITSKSQNYEEAESLVDKRIKDIEAIIGKYIYAKEETSLSKVVVSLMKKHGLSLSSAESCTGGLFSSAVTDIAGASSIYKSGFITYSNEAKIRDLGVPKEIIDNYGAVSYETSEAMAKGLRKVTESDIAVSVTGIAGPDGGSSEKPVGLVFIGLSCGEDTFTYKYNFTGDRQAIRYRSMLMMFKHIYEILWRDYEK